MTADLAALPCPRCKRKLEAISWHDASSGRCHRCAVDFEFIGFPALSAASVDVKPQAVVLDAESVCFFHGENRAEAICDECGRLICPVCTVPFMSRKLCPSCMATAMKQADAPASVRGRVLHDSIALARAALPLIFFVMTIVTAPLALGYAIYAWKKPSSLVRRHARWRVVLAMVFSVGEIAGWILVFSYLPSR